MFDSLSTRLQDVFKSLRGQTRLTPESIEAALREIRLALLEADVNFKVVKAFIDRVRDRAMDALKDDDLVRSLAPSQEVVRIVRDEMVALFAEATNLGFDTVIVDTAGRLHIDDELMHELVAIQQATDPSDRLFVADAMTGQDAIKSAGEFNARVGVTGVVLTKLDGDARGGAALSVVSVVGVPIAFVGSGERLEDLEPFHPERVVSRVLGMGDVLSLIEKAEATIDEDQAERLEEKIRSNEFTLEDFRDQLKMIRKMGPIESIIGMLPGMGNIKALADQKPDEKQLTRTEAIIDSMTPDERRRQHIINGSRRKRIAKGSGTSVEEVNRLLKQFVQMQKMLKSLGGMAGLAGGGRKARRRAMQMMRQR